MHPKFYILDVFENGKYSGNQLAVFRYCEQFTAGEMQYVAKEMNFSETTFILAEYEINGGWPTRIFTPEQELPFAGHPTLGTAFVIFKKMLKEKANILSLNLKLGQIPVHFEQQDGTEIFWMKQKNPEFADKYQISKISEIINVNPSEFDERFPVHVVSTGLPVIIVPLKNLAAIKKANINREKYFEFVENIEAKAIMIFSPETYHTDNDLNCRMFADYFGVTEDPATGSAAGSLAGYLVNQKYFGDTRIDIRLEQGFEIGRSSLLLIKAEKTNEDEIDVNVGGKVRLIAEGDWVVSGEG